MPTYLRKQKFLLEQKKKKDGTVMVGMYRQLSIGNERNKWVCISFDKDDLVLILWTVFFNNKYTREGAAELKRQLARFNKHTFMIFTL